MCLFLIASDFGNFFFVVVVVASPPPPHPMRLRIYESGLCVPPILENRGLREQPVTENRGGVFRSCPVLWASDVVGGGGGGGGGGERLELLLTEKKMSLVVENYK